MDFPQVVGLVYVTLWVGELVTVLLVPRLSLAYRFCMDTLQLVLCFVLAGWYWAHRDWMGFWVFLILGAVHGWRWYQDWKQHRKRMADRMAGRVVDMGGRLKVVTPPPEHT